MQYNFDKTFKLDNVFDGGLLKKGVTSGDSINFHYEIEGIGNRALDTNSPLKDQIVTNQVSELVYFSFEVQRQILFLYKDYPERMPRVVLNRIIECVFLLKSSLSSKNLYEWYDHCVANRSLFLRDFLIFLAKLSDFTLYKSILYLHTKHIKFLKCNINYDYLTNHGIITDVYGLLALRGIQTDRSLKYAKKMYKRSINRIDHYISDDGIPLESSTSYWFLIYKIYKKIVDSGTIYFNLKPRSEHIDKISKVEKFFDILYLNGKYLRIGQASGAHDFPVNIYRPLNSNYKNELVINSFDTGLVLINGYDSNSIVFF